MYCNKCGKFIEYEGDTCNECRQKEQSSESATLNKKDLTAQTNGTVQVYKTVANQPNPMMAGFKKALASAIMPEIAMVVMIFGYAFALVSVVGYRPVGGMLVVFVILASTFMLGATACSIVSLVMGIQSISFVKQTVAAGNRRPIPTMVCGIIGTVTSASALLVSLILVLEIAVIAMAVPYVI